MNERKQPETALMESENKLRNIFDQSPIGIEIYDPHGMLLDANKACLDIFGVLNTEEIKGFRLFDDPNITDELKEKLRNGETVRNEQFFDFEKVKEANLYQTRKAGIIYLSVLITPIGQKKNTGFLVQLQDITDRRMAEEALKKYHEHLEKVIKERTIELTAINKQLQDEIDERRRMEEDLRESEARFRSIVDNSMDGILLTVPDGRILGANPAACRIFERTEEEICRLGRSGIVDTGDPRLPDILEERARTGKAKGELTLIRKDGTKFAGELSSAIFMDKNGNERTSMIIRDITEQKLAEESLSRLASIVEFSKDAIIGKTLDGTITSWNPSAEKLYGYSSEEVIGKPVSILIPEGYPDEIPGILQKISKGEYIKHYETVRMDKNGRKIDVSLSVSPIKDRSGRIIGASAIGRDITERKRAEKALRESEAKYRLIVDTTTEGIWMFGQDSMTTFVNSRMAEMLGARGDEIIGKPMTAFMFEEDWPDHYGKMETRRKGLPENYERRLRRKDGGTVWTLASATPIYDDESHFKGSFGMFTDISERKKAEDEICKLNAELEKRVLERTEELNERNKELQTMIKGLIGREQRVIELKKKIEELEKKVRGNEK